MAAYDKPVLLIGRENMNRAVQGDIVAVEILPEDEWKAPADEVLDQEGDAQRPRRILKVTDKVAVCVATLKNDDADDTDEDGSDDEEARAEQRALRADAARRIAQQKQPTGRIVGIIKRNWKSYAVTFSSLSCSSN